MDGAPLCILFIFGILLLVASAWIGGIMGWVVTFAGIGLGMWIGFETGGA